MYFSEIIYYGLVKLFIIYRVSCRGDTFYISILAYMYTERIQSYNRILRAINIFDKLVDECPDAA